MHCPSFHFPSVENGLSHLGLHGFQMCEERNTRVELGTCLCWCWWPFVAVFNQEVVFVCLLVSRQQFSLERGGTQAKEEFSDFLRN